MAEDSFQTVVSALLDHIIPLIPGLEESLERGIKVMDVGCGSARALNLLAKTFPRSQFSGFDLSPEAIAEGKKQVELDSLNNIHLFARDTSQWDEVEEYDLITTFDAVHDQADPALALAKIHQALKPTGIYLMQDIAGSSYLENNLDHPIAPFLYTISTMHCMTVSMAQNGSALGAMWGKEKAVEMLKATGFTGIEIKQLAHDFQNYFYIITKN
jgi:SAM-dependent methyltransferase